MEELTLDFVASVRFEGTKGFSVTDEMSVLISAQACLLVLEIGLDPLRRVRTVIVHPTTMQLTGPRRTGMGSLMTDAPSLIDGQTHYRGPVIVVWDAVVADARHPARGRNVVFHEFAHQLDMLDGMVDGTPPMSDDATRARWVEVCSREFQSVRDGGDGMLSDYAGTDPGEFFAVATELFFCLPVQLSELHPDLYRVLAEFYRQHPAARARPSPVADV